MAIERSFQEYRDVNGNISYAVTDRRGQKIVRRCLQCRAKRELRLSHVFPSWAGKAHRQEGGFHRGSNPRDASRSVLAQDFNKHYLLCADCEQFYSEAEAYVRNLSRGDLPELAKVGITRAPGNTVSGLNAELLFRFIASMALRTHAAPSASYFRLSPMRASRLRRDIKTGLFADRHSFAIAKMFTAVPDANARAITSRAGFLEAGMLRFELAVGGLYWLYFGRRPGSTKRHWGQRPLKVDAPRLEVTSTGPVVIGPVDVLDLSIVRAYLGVGFDQSLPQTLPSEADACPCGWSGKLLNDCCGQTWFEEVPRVET